MPEAVEPNDPGPAPVRRHRHDWRYILVELGIVTAGLFIALMLNGIVEWAHHKQTVRDARRNIRREIGENRKTVRKDLGEVRSTLARVQTNIATLQRMRAGRFSHGSLNSAIAYAGLDDAAWQTARNTDAVAYMPYDEAQRYSDLYGTVDYVNGRALALIDTQFNAMAPAEMGYVGQLPEEEITTMLRGNAQTKINLLTLMQMLTQLDAQLAKAERTSG